MRSGSNKRLVLGAALAILLFITACAGALTAREHVAYLDKTLAVMDKLYWDTTYKGLDWPKLTAETRAKVEEAPTLEKAMAEIGKLLANLDDHHTRLEPPGPDDMASQDIYGGIGCVISLNIAGGYCLINEVFPDGPADEAGFVAGDRIWAVDGKTVKQFIDENVHPVNAIRGKEGTDVVLTVEKADGKRADVTVTRRQIVHDKTADVKLLADGQIGYITWDNFYDKVSERVEAKLPELAGTKALVIDLRGNPGGLIKELVRIGVFFGIYDLGKSVSRNGATSYRQRPVPALYDKPIAILVDGQTASAAEILSTVAQESGRAKLAGQPTKNGTAAAVSYPLGNGYKLNVTTAQFYTPKGKPYDAPTVPDLQLPDRTEDDIRQGRDPWLDEAVAMLLRDLAERADGALTDKAS